MRRVAANWVLRSRQRQFNQAVVVLQDEYVAHYYEIEDDDMPATEWVGGIIFLTLHEELDLPDKVTVSELMDKLLDEDYTPRYAYHLCGVDIGSTDPFPSGRLVRLEDDGDY